MYRTKKREGDRSLQFKTDLLPNDTFSHNDKRTLRMTAGWLARIEGVVGDWKPNKRKVYRVCIE